LTGRIPFRLLSRHGKRLVAELPKGAYSATVVQGAIAIFSRAMTERIHVDGEGQVIGRCIHAPFHPLLSRDGKSIRCSVACGLEVLGTLRKGLYISAGKNTS